MELINFKGHFKIQEVDVATGNVIDEWEEDNLIMDNARASVAKMFANLNTTPVPFVNKFRIGTLGHNHGTNPHDVGANLLTAKTSVEGFVKERDRMFSQHVGITSGSTTIATLNQGDVVYNGTLDGAVIIGFYQYIGANTTSYATTGEVLNGVDWDLLSATVEPYKVAIDFDLPRVVNGAATITAEDDTLSTGATGCTVNVEQTSTSVIFSVVIPTNVGNGQFTSTSAFTEAALYADNDSIFSMKTFPVKSKDGSAELRITWTITF